MNKRTYRSLVSLSAAAAMLLALAAPSSASLATSNSIQGDDQVTIEQGLSNAGVSATDIATLMEKLANGEVWDSLTSADPVSSETSRSGDIVKTIQRYADGSVAVLETENPTPNTSGGTKSGMVQPMATGTTGCTQSTSSQYQTTWVNCVSKVDKIIFWMAFQYNKTLYPGGATGKITSYSNKQYGFVGASLSGGTLIRQSSSSVRYTGTMKVTQNGWEIYSGTAWIQVTLGAGNNVTLTNN